MTKAKARSTSEDTNDKKTKQSFQPADLFLSSLKAQLAKQSPDKSLRGGTLLKSIKINSPLIIVGTERLRIKRLISWIKDNVFTSDVTVNAYFGTELSTDKSILSITDAQQSQSLFSQEELIIIHDIDQLKSAPARLLAAGLRNHQDFIFTLGTASSINSKTILVNELKDACSIVEIKPLKDDELKLWVAGEVKRCGCIGGISAEAVNILADAYKDDVDSLAQEIAKMVLIIEPNQQISKALVTEVIAKTPLRQSFDLLRFIAGKNIVRASLLAQELEQQGMHALQLVAFLSRCFRILLALKTSQNRTSLGTELGNPWFIKNLQSNLNHYTVKDLQLCLNALKKLDLDLKRSKLSETINLLTCIQRLTLRTG
ncbi:MAG: DNA polymerase III subunit delta [Deltaproteobacteria bacterium]|nr:DNA polymerase III subunit delta [Deltaproteobacteria bacterium]